MRMEKIIERLERDKEIKFEEHQTLEQVQKNFQSAYIENDIVFWESNDQINHSTFSSHGTKQRIPSRS